MPFIRSTTAIRATSTSLLPLSPVSVYQRTNCRGAFKFTRRFLFGVNLFVRRARSWEGVGGGEIESGGYRCEKRAGFYAAQKFHWPPVHRCKFHDSNATDYLNARPMIIYGDRARFDERSVGTQRAGRNLGNSRFPRASQSRDD